MFMASAPGLFMFQVSFVRSFVLACAEGIINVRETKIQEKEKNAFFVNASYVTYFLLHSK